MSEDEIWEIVYVDYGMDYRAYYGNVDCSANPKLVVFICSSDMELTRSSKSDIVTALT